MPTGALVQSALLIEKGTVYVGSNDADCVNLGSVRKVRFTGKLLTQNIDSDNRGTILSHGRVNPEVDFDWLEPAHVSNLETMFKGLVSKSSTAAAIVNNYQQTIASGAWSYDTFIPFDKQNADGTCPNIDSVTLGTDGAIVLNTDYFKTKDPATGKWGITIRDSTTVTTQNQAGVVQYDYTPAAAMTLTGGSSLTQTARYVKIVGPLESDPTKTRTIVLTSAKITSDMLLQFLDVEAANDVGVMPVKATGDKGSTWTYTDQINTN